MATKKTASKTAPPPPQGGARLPLGNHPGNTGGKKGRSGRKPSEFKQMCQTLASSEEVRKQVEKILKKGSKDPMFVAALRWASENGYGKPIQAIDVTSGGKSFADAVGEALSRG